MFLIIERNVSGNSYLVMGREGSMAKVLKKVCIKNSDSAINLDKEDDDNWIALDDPTEWRILESGNWATVKKYISNIERLI